MISDDGDDDGDDDDHFFFEQVIHLYEKVIHLCKKSHQGIWGHHDLFSPVEKKSSGYLRLFHCEKEVMSKKSAEFKDLRPLSCLEKAMFLAQNKKDQNHL